MSGVNKAILIGHLGKDPEVRYSADGKARANVSIATSESWKDRNTGERQEHTEWHNLVFFGALAEIVGKYLRKGSQIFVEGRLQTRKWQDKNTGQDRYITEILVNDMKMLGRRGESGPREMAAPEEDAYSYSAPPTAPAYGSPAPSSYAAANSYAATSAAPMPAPAPIQNTPPPRSNTDLEEDIPF